MGKQQQFCSLQQMEEFVTPTTTLPPGKRARTVEEKEQRRIERIIRNRKSAKESRKRKREELSMLAVENVALKETNELLRKQIEELQEEMKSVKSLLNIPPVDTESLALIESLAKETSAAHPARMLFSLQCQLFQNSTLPASISLLLTIFQCSMQQILRIQGSNTLIGTQSLECDLWRA